ncbi:CHAT domain-containing protein [Flavitalea sp.]|nr:CHAT domain-containing protein [Flavitalea sp.]
MNSLIVGIARTGTANGFLLNPETRYISMCGSKPEITFSIDCRQDEFVSFIEDLRYNDNDPSITSKAIRYFQKLATDIFLSLEYVETGTESLEPLHLRLVTTPLELAQIPFEFALASDKNLDGKPMRLLLNPNRKIILTREVRQESVSVYAWPEIPRILFVWAQPGEELRVPHDEHRRVLTDIVSPLVRPRKDSAFPLPDTSQILTELPDASLEKITAAIKKANDEGRPYTHIHVLAHGGKRSLRGGSEEFTLILCQHGSHEEKEKVTGKSLAEAIVIGQPAEKPAIISLAVCDSGNVGNTVFSAGSLVYHLHNCGIPCVFASQFPLTQNGSVILLETLFKYLVEATDPRLALYEARIILSQEQSHDWASLIAYTRFPENIDEQLEASSLHLMFNSMRVTNAWVDHVFKFWDQLNDEERTRALQRLEERLSESIKQLSRHLNPGDNGTSRLLTEALKAEHLGLLASAYKRQAEFFFKLSRLDAERAHDLIRDSKFALNKAKEYYYGGFEANPTSHWTAMQYLSMKAITEGTLLDEVEIWFVTKRMAQRDEKNAKSDLQRSWAWGTLAEIHLLKPLLSGKPITDEDLLAAIVIAKEYLTKTAGTGDECLAARESTLRQFERYINWWPAMYKDSYPPVLKDIATEVIPLLKSS